MTDLRSLAGVVVLGVSLALVAGCGGGGSGGGSAGGGSYRSAQDVIAALGKAGVQCTGYEQNTDVIGAREDGTCQVGDDDVSITIYQDSGQKATMEKATAALQSGVSVEGDAWVVNVPTRALAAKVKAAVGGNIS